MEGEAEVDMAHRRVVDTAAAAAATVEAAGRRLVSPALLPVQVASLAGRTGDGAQAAPPHWPQAQAPHATLRDATLRRLNSTGHYYEPGQCVSLIFCVARLVPPLTRGVGPG